MRARFPLPKASSNGLGRRSCCRTRETRGALLGNTQSRFRVAVPASNMTAPSLDVGMGIVRSSNGTLPPARGRIRRVKSLGTAFASFPTISPQVRALPQVLSVGTPSSWVNCYCDQPVSAIVSCTIAHIPAKLLPRNGNIFVSEARLPPCSGFVALPEGRCFAERGCMRLEPKPQTAILKEVGATQRGATRGGSETPVLSA